MSKKDTFDMSVMMKFGGEGIYQITVSRNPKEDDRDFWTASKKKIELLEPMLADHHFEIVKAEDLKIL